MSPGSKHNLLGIQKFFRWNLLPILDKVKNVPKQTRIWVEGEDHLLTLLVVLNLATAETLNTKQIFCLWAGKLNLLHEN